MMIIIITSIIIIIMINNIFVRTEESGSQSPAPRHLAVHGALPDERRGLTGLAA